MNKKILRSFETKLVKHFHILLDSGDIWTQICQRSAILDRCLSSLHDLSSRISLEKLPVIK